MPKSPKKIEEKFNPWIKITPEEARLYTLPPERQVNCELQMERCRNDLPDRLSFFIGTDKGLYFAQNCSTTPPIQRKVAELVAGLEEYSIDRLVQQGDSIIVHAKTGVIFKAPIYSLTGLR